MISSTAFALIFVSIQKFILQTDCKFLLLSKSTTNFDFQTTNFSSFSSLPLNGHKNNSLIHFNVGSVSAALFADINSKGLQITKGK